MFRFFCAILLYSFGIECALAQSQTVYRYDTVVIDSSIKCELGRVARSLASSPSFQSNAAIKTAYITVTGSETISRKVSGGFTAVFTGGGAYEKKAGRTRSLEGKRNINIDNSVNCRKSFVVDVGVFSCFQEQRGAFLAGQTIRCTDTSSGTASANLGGKFTVWVIGAEVSGETASTWDWKVEIVAPPKKE